MEDYFAAKKKLFFLNSKKRTAVVNLDDPWGQKLLAELPMATVSFGLEPAAIVRSKVYRLNEEGITAEIDYPGGQVEITSPLMGKHNLSNILASFAVSLVLNVPVAAIQQGLASLQNVPGRMEKIENNRGFQIFIDYAHTDNALKNLLETVRGLRPGRILLVFGAGGDRDKSKRERMGEAAGRLADLIFITSDNPRSEDPMAIIAEIEKGVKKSGAKNYRKIEDRREAIEQALRAAKKGDYVLVAGKGHEPYQIAKDKVLPFHDGEVIRNILTKLEHK
jgi:UDP-N-acetylmuramoyl-L-alanyl-D-glutamate--2,6-diaminopimelate ligase